MKKKNIIRFEFLSPQIRFHRFRHRWGGNDTAVLTYRILMRIFTRKKTIEFEFVIANTEASPFHSINLLNLAYNYMYPYYRSRQHEQKTTLSPTHTNNNKR